MTLMTCVWSSVGTGFALFGVHEVMDRFQHLRRLRRRRGSLERLLDSARSASDRRALPDARGRDGVVSCICEASIIHRPRIDKRFHLINALPPLTMVDRREWACIDASLKDDKEYKNGAEVLKAMGVE